MARRSGLPLLSASTLLLAAVAAAQQHVPPDRKIIELTIVATGKNGSPVQDLKEDEITVTDYSRKQEIVSFEKITAGQSSRGAGVHNYLLIDRLDSTFEDRPEYRLALLKMLNELSKAGNATVVMLQRELVTVSDPAQGEKALLARFAKQPFDPSKPEAFDWVFSSQTAFGSVFTPLPIMPRDGMSAWLKSVSALAVEMEARPGRRNLFWLGVPFAPLVMGEAGASYLERIKDAGSASIRSRDRADLIPSYSKDIVRTSRALRNSGAAVYPLNIRCCGISEMMRDIARSTGGMVYDKDGADAIRAALAESQTTYLIKYVVTPDMANGRDHVIKIETTRKGVKLRARTGYFAELAGN